MFLCKRKILILLVLIIHSTLFGQGYLTDMKQYTVRDGLSSRFISWMIEDSRGFLWLATDNGLNRFDGHDFKVYTQDNSALFSDQCKRVFEDVDGNIWIGYQTTGSTNDVGWGSIVTPDFEIFDLDGFFKNRLPIAADEIHYVMDTPDKSLIIVTNDGAVYKYDGAFTKIAQDENLKNKDFLHLAPSGEIYFHSSKIVLIAQKGVATQILKKPDIYHIAIFKDSNIYWLNYRMLKENPQQVKLYNTTDTIPLFPEDYVVDKTLFKRDLLPQTKLFPQYFIYEDFLKAHQPETGKFSIINKKLEEVYPSTNFESSYLARKNKFWFWDVDGLNLLTYKPNPFKNLLKGVGQSTRTIHKLENGKLLIAPRITDFDIQSGDFRKLSIKEIPPTRGIVNLEEGKYLFGDYASTVSSYDFESDSREEYSLVQSDLDFPGKGFLAPFKASNGNIYVGTDHGLVTFNTQTDSLEVFKKYNEFGEIAKERVAYFKEYSDGIWGTTWDGLFVLKPEEGITAWYKPLPDLRIEHFLREDSVFWLATYRKGLVRWNHKTGAIKQYGFESGLLDESLMAVYPDDNSNLWVTSNWGLARFNRATETFNVFLKSDGINHNEFNFSSHFQDKNGTLYFGGVDGITSFNPNNFTELERDTLSQFVLTGYQEVHSKALTPIDKTSEFLKEKAINIKSNVQSFTLSFALLNYENTANTRFAYQIEGLEDNWTLQKENYIKFSHLPFGKYTLRLKAIDYHGNESKEIAVPLNVIAPFYRRLGWQILGILLLLSLFGLAAWWRITDIRRKNEKLERLVSKRTEELQTLNSTKDRLFAILAHDLRNPIIAFEGLSETINYLLKKGDQKQVEKLGNHIELEAKQIHHLMDNLLNWALSQRDELTLEKSEFSISDFINTVSNDYKHLEERTGVKIIPEYESDVVIKSDKRILNIVTRNIVTNAFRYTDSGGWIKINGFQKENKIYLQFTDNGQGMTRGELENLFDVTQKFQPKGNIATVSLGMHLCKELIELLGGEIAAEAEPNKGTSVTIKLPVSP